EAIPPVEPDLVVRAHLDEQAPLGRPRLELLGPRIDVTCSFAQVDSPGGELALELHAGPPLLWVAEQAVQRERLDPTFLQLDALELGETLSEHLPGFALREFEVELLDEHRRRSWQCQLERELDGLLDEPALLGRGLEQACVAFVENDAAASAMCRIQTRRLADRVIEEEKQAFRRERRGGVDGRHVLEPDLSQEDKLLTIPGRPAEAGRQVRRTAQPRAAQRACLRPGEGEAEASSRKRPDLCEARPEPNRLAEA